MEWTREQEIVALYLYCMIPFNKVNNSNPKIAEMAELIGRPNANSLKAKIGNFGKFDTNLAAAGLGLGSVVITLAAQDTIKNLFGGFIIFLDKPFKIGDFIQYIRKTKYNTVIPMW